MKFKFHVPFHANDYKLKEHAAIVQQIQYERKKEALIYVFACNKKI